MFNFRILTYRGWKDFLQFLAPSCQKSFIFVDFLKRSQWSKKIMLLEANQKRNKGHLLPLGRKNTIITFYASLSDKEMRWKYDEEQQQNELIQLECAWAEQRQKLQQFFLPLSAILAN